MKAHLFFKTNSKIILLFIILGITVTSFSLFSFKQESKYVMVNDWVIKNSEGGLYQKGIINLKFREQNTGFTDRSFGIEQLDNMIANYQVQKVIQKFPLKEIVELRMIGDDDLAKMFSFHYTADVNPEELSKVIWREHQDILEWVEPDFVYEADYIPNDPQINAQYHIWRVMAPEAWDISKGDTNVVIGIVDTGSDLDHPDLQANIRINWDEYPPNGLDSDGNGFIDDWIGWDFIGDGSGMDNDPQIYGSNCDHGSHVSGCASQVTDNGVHGAGVGFNCRLLISKHGNDNDFSGPGGTSFLYNTDAGIIYCYQNGAKVINCSYGSSNFSQQTQNIVNNAWNAGVVIVASAGNQGVNGPRYPASYDNVVSVAASNANDIKTSFSNYHATVDVIAPGQSILSTLWNNNYASLSGTSMSAPITAGVVGLIRSHNPSWTPQQTVDRLKMAIDSIYHIPGNAPFIGLLGTGRVNALKALTDDPVFTITGIEHNDSIYGNNDKVYEIGEIIPIKLDLKNIWLGGNNISIRLSSSDPDIEILKDSVYLGNVTQYSNISTNFNNTFEVRATATCPFDKDIEFTLTPSANARVDLSTATFTIKFRQGFAVHNINNLKLALTADGAIGKKTESYGSGLQLGSSSVNHIYEGGLMIGINENQVSDVVRRGTAPANVSDTDFVALTSYSLTTPGILSSQDGAGSFNDDGAGSTKIGVTVQASSFALNTAGNENYIVLKYMIYNTSGVPLNNLHAGVYIMYNPNGAIAFNTTDFNVGQKIAYTHNGNSPDKYFGVSLLSPHDFNCKIIPASEIFSGFTSQKKWDALSNGTNTTALGPNPNAIVVSGGPISLDPGERAILGFGIVVGDDVGDLITNNNAAKILFETVGVNLISETIPERFSLLQNYPNPFNPVTNIKFDLPNNDFVNLSVYDITGRQVANLVNEELRPGSYEVTFNAGLLSSGVYFYEIRTNSFRSVKKMLLLK